MNRREFMGASAGVLMASQLFAAGAANATAKIPCGILGLGHAHATDIVKTIQNSPDFDLVGIAEPDGARRKTYGAQALFRDVRWLSQDELLGNPDIRMVAVESDVPRLLELGHAVVDTGKNLHLDKPAGTDLSEFRVLLDTAKRNKVLVQMGYMYRYNPGFDFIRTMKAEGTLGDVFTIHATMCTDLPQHIRDRIAFHKGGAMLELGCHLIDMIVLLLGEPKKVTSFLRHDTGVDDDLNDNILAVLEYDRAMVTVDISTREPNAFAGRRFKTTGTDGAITLCPLEPPAAQLSLRKAHGEHPKGVSDIKFMDKPRHVADFADLAAAIRGERDFAYSYEHDYAVQRTILKACGVEV
ncbi:MAG: Gfo/Idh/MocA family oxidoreductase [Candidatus Hydrogenedentes bacterium]|nr:Gfo/Idh/MocA family oxidoreductase [Candidatus Hydrogenedentota bacterium]